MKQQHRQLSIRKSAALYAQLYIYHHQVFERLERVAEVLRVSKDEDIISAAIDELQRLINQRQREERAIAENIYPEMLQSR